MFSRRLSAAMFGVLVVTWSGSVLAQTHEESPMWGKPVFDNPDDIEDPEPWKEGKITLPPYPEDGDLVEINIPSRGDSFDTYIDGKTLIVGEDRVVRYTVVLRSRSGTDNILVEGLRCDAREYRSYATGGNGRLEPTTERPWRAIGQPGGAFAYRLAMSETFACQYDRNPYPKETILKRISGQRGGANDFLRDPY